MPNRHSSKTNSPRAPVPRNIQISKQLSWLLRHGAAAEGLTLDAAGYINLQLVLDNRKLRSQHVSFDEIAEIVRSNDKQRFTLLPVTTPSGAAEQPPSSSDPAAYKIRANQGHSLKLASEDHLTLLSAQEVPETCVHGTSHGAWASIVASGGLKRMGRNHMHFASGLPAGFTSILDTATTSTAETPAAPVISGMRKSSTVLIFVDVGRAMEAGIQFWRSENGVILCEGDGEGMLGLEFFKRVEDRTGKGVLVQDGKVVQEAPEEWGGRKGKGKGKG